jgi:uncharacterized protein HemX
MRHTEAVHKFKLNQIVNLVRAYFLTKSGTASLKYEVVRLLPADTNGEISYRIKSGTAELAVREHEIEA